jgi:hypothetical protein
MESTYFSLKTFVYAVNPKQFITKNGKALTYQVVKAFADKTLFDITLWNF